MRPLGATQRMETVVSGTFAMTCRSRRVDAASGGLRGGRRFALDFCFAADAAGAGAGTQPDGRIATRPQSGIRSPPRCVDIHVRLSSLIDTLSGREQGLCLLSHIAGCFRTPHARRSLLRSASSAARCGSRACGRLWVGVANGFSQRHMPFNRARVPLWLPHAGGWRTPVELASRRAAPRRFRVSRLRFRAPRCCVQASSWRAP